MTIEAHGSAGRQARPCALRERRAFARTSIEPPATAGADDDVLLDEPLFCVRARSVDHEMPVLAFAIEEKAQVRVAADRIAAMGLGTGAGCAP